MTDELISRKALLAEMWRSGKAAYLVVQDAPAVDAVEVVRCKDCLFKLKPKQYGDLQCKILDVPMKNDDFCSYGERKDNV